MRRETTAGTTSGVVGMEEEEEEVEYPLQERSTKRTTRVSERTISCSIKNQDLELEISPKSNFQFSSILNYLFIAEGALVNSRPNLVRVCQQHRPKQLLSAYRSCERNLKRSELDIRPDKSIGRTSRPDPALSRKTYKCRIVPGRAGPGQIFMANHKRKFCRDGNKKGPRETEEEGGGGGVETSGRKNGLDRGIGAGWRTRWGRLGVWGVRPTCERDGRRYRVGYGGGDGWESGKPNFP
ncbi:hypothetical protein GWI33_014209 [Rhynchophorus ferrugineus]|uniref:Uncharacterized protein n=1 Tax=Rhynchophorus ferrugineus TaxID=354439 RepID=A0A834I245_RHYFE|nr:hypothetical protein GWI33_014209 [Rhynchophorus ferrugineus]